jgi:hypothetical protein
LDASNKPLIQEILSCLVPNIHANIDLENLKEKAAARVSSTLEWLPTTCPARRGKGKHGTKENMAEKDVIGSTVVSIDGLTLQDSPRDCVQCREHLADNTKLKCWLAECAQNCEKIKGEYEKLSNRLGSDGVVPTVETMSASDAMVDPPSVQAPKGRANRHTRGRRTRGRGTGSGTTDDT